jgi:hypothetical protein
MKTLLSLSVLFPSKNHCHYLLQRRPKVEDYCYTRGVDYIAEEQKFDGRDAMPPVTKIERKRMAVGLEIRTLADGNNI